MEARWLAFTSTVLALARFAIMRSWSGLIDRSWVATMYQVGLVFQAGDLTWWVNESVEIGTCDTAMNHAFSGGMSAAKSAAKCSCSIHQLLLPSGLNALEACGRALSIRDKLLPHIERKGGNIDEPRNFWIIAGLGNEGAAITVAH